MLEHVRAELAATEDYYRRSAQRSAQVNYFAGMLGGAAFLALVLGSLALLPLVMPGPQFQHLIGSLIAGGLGAIVSVMSRMASGALVLNHQEGASLLRWFGGFRPIIGAILGAALHVMLAGKLLPIEVPADVATQPYFYAGVAFIAGFSERWAQDMLTVTGRRVSASAGDDIRPVTAERPAAAA